MRIADLGGIGQKAEGVEVSGKWLMLVSVVRGQSSVANSKDDETLLAKDNGQTDYGRCQRVAGRGQ